MRTKKESNIQIGERIKESREGTHLTQEQLAERIDVSPQYISDLERGVVGVSIPTLKRLCIALGVSSDRILFGAEEDIHTAIADKCRGLSPEQFRLLMEIAERFTLAVEIERKKNG